MFIFPIHNNYYAKKVDSYNCYHPINYLTRHCSVHQFWRVAKKGEGLYTGSTVSGLESVVMIKYSDNNVLYLVFCEI